MSYHTSRIPIFTHFIIHNFFYFYFLVLYRIFILLYFFLLYIVYIFFILFISLSAKFIIRYFITIFIDRFRFFIICIFFFFFSFLFFCSLNIRKFIIIIKNNIFIPSFIVIFIKITIMTNKNIINIFILINIGFPVNIIILLRLFSEAKFNLVISESFFFVLILFVFHI